MLTRLSDNSQKLNTTQAKKIEQMNCENSAQQIQLCTYSSAH